MTSVLVTGAGGQVGRELLRAVWPDGTEVVGLTRTELDITDKNAVLAAVDSHSPSLIVNAAAFTAVEAAETHADQAFQVNANAVEYLAAAATTHGCALLQLSTDYVFDGAKSAAYVETDSMAPLNVYGHSKAAGEIAASSIDRHVILRSGWLYSGLGNNFVATMLQLGRSREEVSVVSDQFGCPTAASDLATAIVDIAGRVGADNELQGTYNVASPQSASWYEFAVSILDKQSAQVVVKPVASSDYPRVARRPLNSRLDSTAIHRDAGIRLPDWSNSLPKVLQELARSTP